MTIDEAVNLDVMLAEGQREQAALKFEQAEQRYRRILEIDETHRDAMHLLAVVHMQRGELAEAEALLAKVVDMYPEFAFAYSNLALVLKRTGRIDEASRCLHRAIELNPNFPEAYNNLGLLYEAAMHAREAERLYRTATRLNGTFHQAWFNLGNVLRRTGRLSDAEACYRMALQIQPNYGPARVNRGVNFLALGRYEEAWELYEDRYRDSTAWRTAGGVIVRRPETGVPQWNGECLRGKSLMVVAEQGAGDCIQFARFLPLLRHLGLSNLSVACPPTMQILLSTVEGVDRCIPLDQLAKIAGYDYWTFIMSLPFHLGITLGSLPIGLPYVRTTRDCRDRWCNRIPKGKYGVGLVWAGDVRRNGALHWEQRSMHVVSLLPLLQTRGVLFVSLQKGSEARQQLHTIPSEFRPLDPMDDVDEFSDTAAIIDELDLIVTVDTAVAHLAGALGKEVWVLLRSEVDWQWALMCHESPWYPGVMRLIRQETPGDWRGVVDRVQKAVAQRLGGDEFDRHH